MPIVFNNKEHGRIISRAIPRQFNVESDPVISNVREDGTLLGGVTFDGYTRSCIFMHQAGFDPHWMTRDLLWAAFDYPFNQLGVVKVCGTIPSSDERLVRLNHKIGFVEECRVKDGYPGADMIVLSMTRDQCRWLQISPRSIKPSYPRG